MKQGWEIKKLGEVCESDLGKTLNQSKDTGELRPYLCAVNVLWDKIDFTTLKETRFENAELERYTIKKGDLLICEGGDIGRAAIWNYDYEIQYQNALHRVRLDDSIRPRFLLLHLKHLKDSGVLDTRYGKGVTIKHLVKSSLLSIPIPIPPREEQERIVAELDCLSGVIERKREQLRELDALAQSIFYQMFGDPITNEKGWEVSTIENVCSSIVRGPFGSALKKEYFVEQSNTTYKVYEQKHAIQKDSSIGTYYISADMFETLSRFEIKEGDIIMSCSGTIGEFYEIPIGAEKGIMNQALLKYTLNKNIHKTYFLYIMEWVKENFEKKGSGLQNIGSVKTIKSTDISLPPLPLQQEFANKIEAIEKQKELIKQSITQTEELFNSRMNYYFN